MGHKHDDQVQEAEAKVSRIQDALLTLEAERDAALERLDQIADEPFESPEEEASLSQKVEAADQEYGRCVERVAEAEDDLRRAQEHYDSLISGAYDDAEDSSDRLDVYAAADVWRSNGMDEDYTFGYTEDELRRAAEEG